VSFTKGKHAALDGGRRGLESVRRTARQLQPSPPRTRPDRDFRAKGRLQYVNKHHLQFAGTKEYFLKAGADAPETLLAFEDFDGTVPAVLKVQPPGGGGQAQENAPSLRATPARLGRPGDPTWKDGKARGLIGALNYLAAKGVNAFSFLPVQRVRRWRQRLALRQPRRQVALGVARSSISGGVVLDHGTAKGLYLHFKLAGERD